MAGEGSNAGKLGHERVRVPVPENSYPGQLIDVVTAENRKFSVKVPHHEAFVDDTFEILVPRLPESMYTRRQRSTFILRWLKVAFPTVVVGFIWLLEFINLLVHEILRPELYAACAESTGDGRDLHDRTACLVRRASTHSVFSSVCGSHVGILPFTAICRFVFRIDTTVVRVLRWSPVYRVVGYSLLALQVLSFARMQLTHPGSPAASWVADAVAEKEAAQVCARSGVLLPARAGYVFSSGVNVLFLDHYCFWIGIPIGHRNRRFFVLFLFWSTMLAAYMGLLSLVELLHNQLPSAYADRFESAISDAGGAFVQLTPLRHMPEVVAKPLSRGLRYISPASSPLIHLAIALQEHGLTVLSAHSVLLHAVAVINLTAAVPLGMFCAWHVSLVLRGRVSVDPKDDSYDLGALKNWRVVFGESWLGWVVPIISEPAGDGVHFEMSPRRAKQLAGPLRVGGILDADAAGCLGEMKAPEKME